MFNYSCLELNVKYIYNNNYRNAPQANKKRKRETVCGGGVYVCVGEEGVNEISHCYTSTSI